MNLIWTKHGPFRQVVYQKEAELEAAILKVQDALFGRNRIYLDVKKKIGSKSGRRNIPDGYLLDLSGREPRLYVVENELASHDPLRHIAVQILQFSLSFADEPRTVKTILYNALHSDPKAKSKCEAYASTHDFRNLDHLLEKIVFEGPFAALVIIDKKSDELENLLAKSFQFGVDVLELAQYKNKQGERLYHFEPFLADLSEEEKRKGTTVRSSRQVDITDVDTVVVPAREDGFQQVFIGENRWYAIRLHGTMRPQVKYIAAYRVAPVSAITHVAPVRSIDPWKETGKFVVNFSQPAQEIRPIKLVKRGAGKALQNLRYTTKAKLDSARTLDDVF